MLFSAVPAAANAVFPVTYLFLPGFGRAFWGVVVLEAFLWSRELKITAPRAAGLSLALNLLSWLGGIPLALIGLDRLDRLPGVGLESFPRTAPPALWLRPLDFLLKSLWIEGGRGLGPILWSLTVITFIAAAMTVAVEFGALWAGARVFKVEGKTLWRAAWRINLASYALLWPAILLLGSYWIAHPERAKTAVTHWGVFSILESLGFWK